MWPFKWRPKALQSFFQTRRCPDCGCRRFSQWQDGGHDVAIECLECGSKFGIQEAPFEIIGRIGSGKGGRGKEARS
jgi:DNA-directed RNA polymerase subunit RPC12/RpoP